MKAYVIASTFILLTTFSFGQVVDRAINETAEQFVNRIKPEKSVITHKVIQTSWDLKSAIIAFYDQTYKFPAHKDSDQQEYHRIIATIFIMNKNHQYYKIIIDTIGSEGGDPKIESVFFANADKDLKKELIIISSWEQRHLDMNGTLYGTSIYDNILNIDQRKLSPLKSLSTILSGGCECEWSDGTHKTSKFKTAAHVKEELKRLGNNQVRNY